MLAQMGCTTRKQMGCARRVDPPAWVGWDPPWGGIVLFLQLSRICSWTWCVLTWCSYLSMNDGDERWAPVVLGNAVSLGHLRTTAARPVLQRSPPLNLQLYSFS